MPEKAHAAACLLIRSLERYDMHRAVHSPLSILHWSLHQFGERDLRISCIKRQNGANNGIPADMANFASFEFRSTNVRLNSDIQARVPCPLMLSLNSLRGDYPILFPNEI